MKTNRGLYGDLKLEQRRTISYTMKDPSTKKITVRCRLLKQIEEGVVFQSGVSCAIKEEIKIISHTGVNDRACSLPHNINPFMPGVPLKEH